MEFSVKEMEGCWFRLGWEGETVISLTRQWAAPEDKGTHCGLSELVFGELQQYFRGERQCFSFPLGLNGTPFQLRVWNALLQIPYGQTRSYGQIAAQIGAPKASRAVGGAIHRNPILIAVPCHRVVGASGQLTGFAAGLDLKEKLLELEKRT